MDNSESGDDLAPSFISVSTEEGYKYILPEDFDEETDPLNTDNTDDSNHDGNDKHGMPLREQDRFLPIANVAKIMKRAIPECGKIAKDARECVQECVSEFISFITSEASDRCHLEKRKTINGEDILFAMSTLGFDNYIEPLKIYLQKYREVTKSDKHLQPNEIIYEETVDDNFGQVTLSANNLQLGQGDTVIYTYSDNLQVYQQFNNLQNS